MVKGVLVDEPLQGDVLLIGGKGLAGGWSTVGYDVGIGNVCRDCDAQVLIGEDRHRVSLVGHFL